MAHIISIIGQKGGIGKTTIAWNLFITLLSQGYKVKLVDCDNNQFSTYEIAQIRKNKLGGDLVDVECMPANEARYVLRECDKSYDVIIFECGGRIDDELKMAISYGDKIIMPLKPSILEIQTIKNVEKVIDRIPNFNADCKILPNMVSTHHLNNDLDQMKNLNPRYFKFMKSFISHRSIYSSSLTFGRSIFEMSPLDNKANNEFNNFLLEL
tara:strand:+ start:19135 stop:19767 length:633 start_codon:yes stop_codon:yes gene_type:complete